jgi:diaminopropionate ammonia-lyase
MAGLNCGTVSSVAWPVIRSGIDLFITVSNERAVEAMKLLAGAGIISGESGAAGIAGLLEIKDTAPHLMDQLGLNRKVLAISTEGITDSEAYYHAVEKR